MAGAPEALLRPPLDVSDDDSNGIITLVIVLVLRRRGTRRLRRQGTVRAWIRHEATLPHASVGRYVSATSVSAPSGSTSRERTSAKMITSIVLGVSREQAPSERHRTGRTPGA